MVLDNTLPMFALKAFRAANAYAAAFISQRMFYNMYIESVNSSKPTVPDLKWFVGVYMAFLLLFDAFFLGVLWFLRRMDIGNVTASLVKDFLVDTLISDAMIASTLLWMAAVIQDKRYFEYRASAPRALRVMRQLAFYVSASHAVVPYFYLLGPVNAPAAPTQART
jgi:hypothetical protein